MKILNLYSFLKYIKNILHQLNKNISNSKLITLNKLNKHQLKKHNQQKKTSTYNYLINI